MGERISKGLSDQKAARMMAALHEGRTLRLFGVRPARLKAYFKCHSEYAREAIPLIKANARAAYLRKGERNRSVTHCVNGHLLAISARVVMHNGYLSRRCNACDYMRYKRGGIIKPSIFVKVKTALQRGLTINAITNGGSPSRLVAHHALSRRRREDPAFDQLVRESTKNNNSKAQRLRWQRTRNAKVREENNDYHKILAMLPPNFPDKDDVVNAIFVDLLTGKLAREDVRVRVQAYVTAHNRMFPTKFAKFGNALLLSLDEVMFEDGTATRGDTVSRGLWD
jgi:hypothetical protein